VALLRLLLIQVAESSASADMPSGNSMSNPSLLAHPFTLEPAMQSQVQLHFQGSLDNTRATPSAAASNA
jgi:hypothetical protein